MSGPPAIRFAAIRTDGVALIEISDNGPGFPPEQASRHLRALSSLHARRRLGARACDRGRPRRAQRRFDRARSVAARRFLLRRAFSHHSAGAEDAHKSARAASAA